MRSRPVPAARTPGAAAARAVAAIGIAAIGIAALAIAGAATPLAAQSSGVVRGTVTAQSGQPVPNAQVAVVGTTLGALTNAAGAYQITAVPAGPQTIRVRMLGFAPADKPVTVAAGQAAVVDFALAPRAVSLDEVVVTGTAGQARKREVGNAISQVRAADAPEALTNVSNFLAGRVAGASVLQSAGVIGAGSSVRLRGNTSVALSNQPLVYVDGVRVRSDEYPKNVPAAGGQNLRSSHVNGSPLNDINPDDIDRVEVLKGAAASTLYGTEAAAGVIQIFTKRGASGKAQWTMQTNQGIAKERPFGTDAVPYMFMDPWLRTANRGSYLGSVAGGSAAVRYFTSGSYESNEGVLPNDHEKKYTVRGNFNYTPTPKLTLEWTSAYTNNDLNQTPAGNNAHGLTLNAFRRDRNYFGSANVDTISQVLDFKLNSGIDRLILGGTATWAPLEHFTHKVTLGLDRAAIENRQLRPFGFPGVPQGIISDQMWVAKTMNVDYVANWDYPVSSALKSTLSWGGQSATTDTRDVEGYAENLPPIPVPTVSSGSARQGFETRQKVINAGFFVQELIGLRDRYFLTGGVRVDGNSAFGEDFGLQTYPKLSASWVASDESFWHQGWGTLKLRAAYGEAGRAPGAFDAVRTWDAIGWGGLPALRPRNLGNPNLGPERTKEIEVGFEGSALNERLSVDFTWFRARTTDALLRVRQPASTGAWDSQLENIGKLQKRGIELAVNGALIRSPKLGWNAGFTVATNHSLALDLGGAPTFAMASNPGTISTLSTNGFGYVAQGQPVPVIRARLIRNPDAVGVPADTVVDYYFGPSQPTHILTGTTSIRAWKGIELSLRGEFQGGHWLDEDASFQALSRSVEWPTCQSAYDKIKAGQQAQLTVRENLWCIQRNVRSDMFIYPADFFKLRDVSLRVPLGRAIPRTTSSSLVVSAGNWYTWKKKDFPVFDPEQAGNDGFNAGVRYISEHIPAPATVTAQLKVQF
jgi:TonB-dependent SusC/RagA subfamily outer membrane receptor